MKKNLAPGEREGEKPMYLQPTNANEASRINCVCVCLGTTLEYFQSVIYWCLDVILFCCSSILEKGEKETWKRKPHQDWRRNPHCEGNFNAVTVDEMLLLPESERRLGFHILPPRRRLEVRVVSITVNSSGGRDISRQGPILTGEETSNTAEGKVSHDQASLGRASARQRDFTLTVSGRH